MNFSKTQHLNHRTSSQYNQQRHLSQEALPRSIPPVILSQMLRSKNFARQKNPVNTETSSVDHKLVRWILCRVFHNFPAKKVCHDQLEHTHNPEQPPVNIPNMLGRILMNIAVVVVVRGETWPPKFDFRNRLRTCHGHVPPESVTQLGLIMDSWVHFFFVFSSLVGNSPFRESLRKAGKLR